MSWPWSQLGLPGPSGLSEIRHAYAEKLKTTHPEEDPEGFQRLHSAYQLASRMARQQKRRAEAQAPGPDRPAGPAPKPAPPPEDFDELHQEGGGQPQPSREQGGEDFDFDFDELLQGDGGQPRRPQEKEPDWDYDRLFAEGEAERAEYRRRRGEERRREQRQQSQERRRQWDSRAEQLNVRFRQEQDRWQNTETILHTMEVMYNSRAETEIWKKFFQSSLFQQNRNSLDLIFGLEDFVSGRSLPQEVRSALFLAYGFDKGVSRPELRPLFQMLLPAWKAERKVKSFSWKPILLAFFVDLVFLLGIGPLLDSGLIPVALYVAGMAFIVWVIRKAVILGNQERRARDRHFDQNQQRRTMIMAILCVVALVAVMSWIRLRPGLDWGKLIPAKDPREQTCRYIEEDLGVKVGALYNLSDYYASDAYGNVFYLEGDPNNRRFLAGPDGDRDKKNGQPGYATNLPEMMMLWALEDFALERKIYGVDTLDRDMKLALWETSGTFVLTLPAGGAGEVITDLGALLEELSREPWYQAQPPVCEVVLCGRQMIEGRLILSRWHPADGAFDAEELRERYESTFAHSYCAQLLKELELDRDFFQEEGERYILTNEGTAVIRNRECYKLCGLDEAGAVALEYYVDLESNNIYCFPGDFWETGNSEDQINIYRVLHWGDNFGLVCLFYPWLRVN